MRVERRMVRSTRGKHWTSVLCGLIATLILCLCSVSTAYAEGATTQVEPPEYTPEAGFYGQDCPVTLHAGENAVYYTLDGSMPEPGKDGTYLFSEPITIRTKQEGASRVNAYVIRSIAVDEDGNRSEVVTKTYFCGPEKSGFYTVPVISLVTEPDNLYDPSYGIFANPYERGEEWERPMHFSYFVDGKEVLNMDVGARIHGGASRGADVKSMRLYARKEYDEQNEFAYAFFADGPIEAVNAEGTELAEFKRLLIRNGGNESNTWDRSLYRDFIAHQAAAQVGLDIQAGRPVIVFLNGEFYGVLNLQERVDEHYLKEHYDIAEEDSAIYEFWYDESGKMHVGVSVELDELYNREKEYYKEAYAFCTEQDMSDPDNYAKAREYYDIDNFIDYYCIQIYSGNEDWPGNNCKAWRYIGAKSSEPGKDGKIRWLLYDTEFGWSLYGASPERDALAELFEVESTEWPNPWGSTALFRSLLENEEFRRAFVTRFLDMMNTNLRTEGLVAFCDRMEELYTPILYEYRESTSQYFADPDDTAEQIRNYVSRRDGYMKEHLDKVFDLGQLYDIKLAFDVSCGTLYVNTLEVTADSAAYKDAHFYGQYAANYPVTLTMVAKDGYRFVGWKGYVESSEAELVLEDLENPRTIVLMARFEKEPTPTITETPLVPEEPMQDASVEEDSSSTMLVVGLVACTIMLAVAVWLILSGKKTDTK